MKSPRNGKWGQNINLTNTYDDYMGKNKKIAMTIAGSDSSAGAGIQTDLKTFTSLGLHGITVLTCITAQNTKKVDKIYKLPVSLIENQIDLLMKDMKPDFVKTGMLYNKEIVECVTKKIKKYNLKVVVDPVMASTSNDSLSNQNISSAFIKSLFPVAFIITPNINEASVLTGIKITNIDDAKKACKILYQTGVKNVLIKGGHLKGDNVYDVFYNGEKNYVFSLPRVPNRKAHGSGCTLSALITGYLALGNSPVESIKKSKNILWNMIFSGYKPGKGSDVLNFDFETFFDKTPYLDNNAYYEIFFNLKESVEKLLMFLPNNFVPEVGINFGYALPNAKKFDDVCAINGRIIRANDKVVKCGMINFGSSKHVSSIILSAMSFDSDIRSAINIRYSKNVINKCEKIGFKVGFFDREKEPDKVSSTMEWGTKSVIKKLGFVPDIIYDKGGIGKEPMIRVLGENPSFVVKKLYKILKF